MHYPNTFIPSEVNLDHRNHYDRAHLRKNMKLGIIFSAGYVTRLAWHASSSFQTIGVSTSFPSAETGNRFRPQFRNVQANN